MADIYIHIPRSPDRRIGQVDPRSGRVLGDSWMCILIDLLNNGTDIYVLNDDGEDRNDPEWSLFNSVVSPGTTSTSGTYAYVPDVRTHYDDEDNTATNRSNQLVDSVFAWITSN